jgi:membrane protein YdbS with pleckstrin-like domain
MKIRNNEFRDKKKMTVANINTMIICVCLLLCTPFLIMLRKLQFMGWAYMSGMAFHFSLLFAMVVILIKCTNSTKKLHSVKGAFKAVGQSCAIGFTIMMLIMIFIKYFVMN